MVVTKAESNKRYYLKNKEVIKEYQEEYRVRYSDRLSKLSKEHRHTFNGWLSEVWGSMRRQCRKRGHALPTFTKKELGEWVQKQNRCRTLFDTWKCAGYGTDFRPSIDRLDNLKSYSFDNVQLTTWCENNANGREYRRVRVIRTDAETGIMVVYQSITEAAKKTHGGNRRAIGAAILGKTKQSAGYKWEKV